MRFAYVITRSDAIGGAHVHVRDLALYLLAGGHHVTVLVGGEGPFTHDLAVRGIPYHSLHSLVHPISLKCDAKGLFELRRELSSIKPDLVCTHSSKAGWLGRLAAKSLGLPTVFTVHGWAFTEGVNEYKRRLYVLAERMAAPLADRIITVSDYDRRLALRYRITAPGRLVTIHNGVPDVPSLLRAEPRRQPPRLVMVARFEPQKDHVTLLKALAALKELVWELELIGDGPVLEQVRIQASILGLTDRVRFLGARHDVAERLAEAQALVLVSNWEGLPLSVLEGMRAGVPVVASDVGGVSEAVVDGETGFLVPRRRVDILKERLQMVIESTDLRTRMGKAGRARYERHFTLERMISETLYVYQQVIGGAA